MNCLKEFNLKEEREQLRKSIVIENLSAKMVLNLVENQDKEFIKRLKEALDNEKGLSIGWTVDLKEIIDKLAGGNAK